MSHLQFLHDSLDRCEAYQQEYESQSVTPLLEDRLREMLDIRSLDELIHRRWQNRTHGTALELRIDDSLRSIPNSIASGITLTRTYYSVPNRRAWMERKAKRIQTTTTTAQTATVERRRK